MTHGLAGDWGIFYAAVELTHRGMSPYSQQALQSAEQSLHAPFSIGNFPYLPMVAWLLTPATLLPFWISFAVLPVIRAAIAVTSPSVWVREAGWKRAGLWIIAAMGSCLMFGVAVDDLDLRARGKP